MSDERRRRYFNKVDARLSDKQVRARPMRFVRHDLARDPPFSKLDLVSCRNVLIYFDQALQKRILRTLHYALNQPGFLVLGRTESTTGFSGYSRRRTRPTRSLRGPRRQRAPISPPARELPLTEGSRSPSHWAVEHASAVDVAKHLDRLLLARYAPPGVLINEKLEILQFCGANRGVSSARAR